MALLALLGGSAEAQTPVAEGVTVYPVDQPHPRSSRYNISFGTNPFLPPDFWRYHHYDSNGGKDGDNVMVGNFFDAVHNRFIVQSIQCIELEDPCDIRLGRTPELILGSDGRQHLVWRALKEGDVVGQIGGVGATQNGSTSYQSVIQFVYLNPIHGKICFSFKTGVAGRHPMTTGGSTYGREDPVCHIAMMPDGSMIIGAHTDPTQTPPLALDVHGNVRISGNVTIEGNITVTGNMEVGGTITARKFEVK